MITRKGTSNIYGQKIAWTVWGGNLHSVYEWKFVNGKKTSSAGNGNHGGRVCKTPAEKQAIAAALTGSPFRLEVLIQAEIDRNIELAQGPITKEMRDALKWTDDGQGVLNV